jgi:hypothetical protein
MLGPPLRSLRGAHGNSSQGLSFSHIETTSVAVNEEGHFVWTPGCTFDRCQEFPNGRYLGASLLGSGTYGKVIECLDQKHNARVAIKAVRRGCPAYKAAAEREIIILRDLNGLSDTPKILRDFEHAGHICMVFDVLGETLKSFIEKRCCEFSAIQGHSCKFAKLPRLRNCKAKLPRFSGRFFQFLA